MASRDYTDSEIPPVLNPRQARTLPPPSIDKWLASHPKQSRFRTPSGRLTLASLGYVDA